MKTIVESLISGREFAEQQLHINFRPIIDHKLYQSCLDKVKADFRAKRLNPDLDGWVGFVQGQARRMYFKSINK